jgi:HNH endonuclease
MTESESRDLFDEVLNNDDPSLQLVVRSEVVPGKPYRNYRAPLRWDFFYSCAYCTMTEAEAQAIRFTIDHYEPRSSRPDLENDYSNLMYSCDECNTRKGDRSPPEEARSAGHRFFRPDQDVREDHLSQKGVLLESKSNTGFYSIEALDLNRSSLRRLREIRERLLGALQSVETGILSLRRFPIDQLPPPVRGRVVRAVRQAEATQARLMDDVDALLREYARSPLLEEDEDAEARRHQRVESLRSIEALHPGVWRGRKKSA